MSDAYEAGVKARKITDPIGQESDTATSGLRNVYWTPKRNRWRAKVTIDGKSKELGYFKDKERALEEVARYREHVAAALGEPTHAVKIKEERK